jgi:hypothetical protein
MSRQFLTTLTEGIKMSQKINLNQVTNLVKRGREAFHDDEIVADILSLDSSIDGDAVMIDKAQGTPSDDDYVNHKNTWRNRVAKCAEIAQRDVSIYWTETGEMIVALKVQKKKRNRK